MRMSYIPGLRPAPETEADKKREEWLRNAMKDVQVPARDTDLPSKQPPAPELPPVSKTKCARPGRAGRAEHAGAAAMPVNPPRRQHGRPSRP